MNPYIALSTAVLSDHRLIDPELFTTYVRGLLYSKVHQTDGFIPTDALPLVTIGVTRDVTLLVTRLVTSGLWIECENGYTVGAEKWAKWQETRDDDEKRRVNARDRQRAKRERDAEKLAQFLAVKAQESPDSVTRDSPVTHSEVTVHRREEKRREETKDSTTPTPSKGSSVKAPRRTWDHVQAELMEIAPEALRETLCEYCQYKRERKDEAWTPTGTQRWVAKYSKWATQDILRMLDHVMTHNWKGIPDQYVPGNLPWQRSNGSGFTQPPSSAPPPSRSKYTKAELDYLTGRTNEVIQ